MGDESVAVVHAQTSADSSIVLQWTAPGDDGTAGRATSYDLRYRTTSITGTDTLSWWNGATQATGEPTPGVSGSTDSLRVRGLQPVTTYYFMVRAADEVPNWSGYSNLAVKATTGDTTAPAAITSLAITGTTGTTIALRWTSPGDDGASGTARTYDVRYATTPITAANWTSATTVTGEPAPLIAGTVADVHDHGPSGQPDLLRRHEDDRRWKQRVGTLQRGDRRNPRHDPAGTGPRHVVRRGGLPIDGPGRIGGLAR